MRSGAQPPIGSTWHLGSASEPRPPVGCSPRVRPFPPRSPPEVAFLCSVASSVLRPHPTSHPRTCSAYGYCLPEPARHKSGHGCDLPGSAQRTSPRAQGLRLREVLPMQATTPWEMLPSRQRTRSAPRNKTRFAAQYSARGLPCERFTAALASRTSCITRGRGGWLDLPRGGLAPPILCQLPGALAYGTQLTTIQELRGSRRKLASAFAKETGHELQ